MVRSHTGLAYLKTGLTNAMQTCSFTNLTPIFRVHLSSPSQVLLALLVVVLTWDSQVASKVSITPTCLHGVVNCLVARLDHADGIVFQTFLWL